MANPPEALECVSAALDGEIRRQGVVFLARHHPEVPTAEIAGRIGRQEVIAGIPPVQALRPKSVEASTLNLYSGNFGLGAFPYHTDLAHWFMPPRYILLRCQRGSNEVFTSVLTWESALAGLSAGVVQRARFRPRRPLRGQQQLLPFAQRVGTESLLRWDSLFIVPDNDDALVVASQLSTLDVGTAGKRFVLRDPGDTLLIDNWRVLHGRGCVQGMALERVVERAYLSEIKGNG